MLENACKVSTWIATATGALAVLFRCADEAVKGIRRAMMNA